MASNCKDIRIRILEDCLEHGHETLLEMLKEVDGDGAIRWLPNLCTLSTMQLDNGNAIKAALDSVARARPLLKLYYNFDEGKDLGEREGEANVVVDRLYKSACSLLSTALWLSAAWKSATKHQI